MAAPAFATRSKRLENASTKSPSSKVRSIGRVYETREPKLMTVKFYNPSRGFGFFAADDEADVFVHHEVLRRCRIEPLTEGQKMMVTYGPNVADANRRLMATAVAPVTD